MGIKYYRVAAACGELRSGTSITFHSLVHPNARERGDHQRWSSREHRRVKNGGIHQMANPVLKSGFDTHLRLLTQLALVDIRAQRRRERNYEPTRRRRKATEDLTVDVKV